MAFDLTQTKQYKNVSDNNLYTVSQIMGGYFPNEPGGPEAQRFIDPDTGAAINKGQMLTQQSSGMSADQQGNMQSLIQTKAANAYAPDLSVGQPTQTSINSASLQSGGTTNYQTATPTQPYNVASLAPPPLEATPQENQQSDLITKLQSLNDEFAGKSEYQTQQESLQGVDAKQATKNSLLATQRQLINEGIQSQLAVQQGQGVTTAVDQRQRNEALRVNAINSLSISSLIAAADGDLANAQLLADRAVKEKFDPIEAEIAAKMNNLNLIRNDPKTSREDQNRADAQQAIVQQQAAAAAQQKSDMANILNISADAAANGATAAQLQKIQKAKTPGEALQIMAGFGLNTEAAEANTVLSPSEAKTLGVPYGTTKEQAFGTATDGTTNPYSDVTFMTDKGEQVSGKDVISGKVNASYLLDMKTGEKLTPSQIKGATKTTSTKVATTLAGVKTGGTYTSGSLQITPDLYQEAQNTLLSTSIRDAQGNPNRGSDGFTNPAVYLSALQDFITAGGVQADFLKLFPVDTYINKKNTWPAILALGGGTKPKATSTSSGRSA